MRTSFTAIFQPSQQKYLQTRAFFRVATLFQVMLNLAQSVGAALADSPAAGLIARAEHTHAIARLIAPAIAELAPDFDPQHPGRAELRDGVLLLNTLSAAQAVKLRQGVPRLLRALHQQGAQVYEIRVRVSPAQSSYPEQASVGPQVSAVANPALADLASARDLAAPMAFAEELSLTLPESPLRQAVNNLRASLSRLLTGTRDPEQR